MKKWFNRQSYATKLFFLLLAVVLISILTLSVFVYQYSGRILEEKTNNYLKSLSSVSLSKIDDTIKNVENIAFYVNGDDVVQDCLKQEREKKGDRTVFYNLYNSVKNRLVSYTLFYQQINSITILSGQGKRYSYAKEYRGVPLDVGDYIDERDKHWSVDGEHILFVKTMYAYPTHEALGSMAVDVREQGLYQIIADINLSANGKVFLVNEEGIIVATKDSSLMGARLDQGYMELFGPKEAFYKNVEIDGVHYSVYNSKPTSNGWHILLAMPREEYIKDISSLRNVVVLVTALILAVAAVLSVFASHNSTRSIRDLSRAMEEFGQGNFDIVCSVNSQDEIGKLGETFNRMVSDMNSLVDTVYEQKLMKQKAQMKSLQLQINPHFLYNTLDTINWMARMKQADDIGDMVAALGNMMRYSLAKNSFATIEEEVRNLKDYLFIQGYRYGDKMTAEIVIDPSLYDIYVPRLLIQPILENAIVHGIEEKLDEGHIIIRGWTEGEDLYLQVEDDGVGMTEEAIFQILNEEEARGRKGHTSIGIVNVNRRIRMTYGREYGLMIQSELGTGTKMTLHIGIFYEIADLR